MIEMQKSQLNSNTEHIYNITRLSDGAVKRVKSLSPVQSIIDLFNLDTTFKVVPCDMHFAHFKVDLLDGKRASQNFYRIDDVGGPYSMYVFIPNASGTEKLKEITKPTKEEMRQFTTQGYIVSNIVSIQGVHHIFAKYNDNLKKIQLYKSNSKNIDELMHEFLDMVDAANNHELTEVFARWREFPNNYMDSNTVLDFAKSKGINIKNGVGGSCRSWYISTIAGTAVYKNAEGHIYLSVDKVGDNH